MMKIIAVTNQKGGVGKTTTSINLAAGLGIKNKKVLLIDSDPQANSTTGIGVLKEDIKTDLFDVIINDADINESILDTPSVNVDLIPASINLSGADIYLSVDKSKDEYIFSKQLKNIKKKYDYVIIDCPPSLGLLNRNSLVAADSVIIPVQAEYYALEGLTQLLSTVSLVKKMFNKKLVIEGILITRYDKRTNLAREVKDEVRKFFKEKVYKTMIPTNTTLAAAPSAGRDIFQYDKNSTGAKSYDKFVQEVLDGNK
ncbi:MAG: ParA family protein [Tenericutes bacterium]|nr:MAG: ParA family protein [Mycoplasmatota bacterium]